METKGELGGGGGGGEQSKGIGMNRFNMHVGAHGTVIVIRKSDTVNRLRSPSGGVGGEAGQGGARGRGGCRADGNGIDDSKSRLSTQSSITMPRW